MPTDDDDDDDAGNDGWVWARLPSFHYPAQKTHQTHLLAILSQLVQWQHLSGFGKSIGWTEGMVGPWGWGMVIWGAWGFANCIFWNTLLETNMSPEKSILRR